MICGRIRATACSSRLRFNLKKWNKYNGYNLRPKRIVVDAPQLPVEEHAGDHQQVGEDRHQDDREEDDDLANIRESDFELLLSWVFSLVGKVAGWWIAWKVEGGEGQAYTPHHQTSLTATISLRCAT